MAYAEVAGLPPVVGLWAIVGPLLVYAVLGSSRQLSVGPESTTALMTAAAIGPLAAGDPERYAGLAAALAPGGRRLLPARLGRPGSGSSRTCFPSRCSSATWPASPHHDRQPARQAHGHRGRAGLRSSPRCARSRRTWTRCTARRWRSRRPCWPSCSSGSRVAAASRRCRWSGCCWPPPRWPSSTSRRTASRVVGDIPRRPAEPALPTCAATDLAALLLPAVGLAIVAYSDNVLTARAFAARNGYASTPTRSSSRWVRPTWRPGSCRASR